MDYSKLSDFEINRYVFKAKSGLSTLGYPHNGDNRSCGHKDINGTYHWFDFCNNPTDAWPIINANRIALYPATKGDKWAAHYANWDIAHADENALRAAMIVFLLKRESANVQDNPA